VLFLKKVITTPLLYLSWAGFVVTALVGTYFVDPYVFGMATLTLLWLSTPMGAAGVLALLFVRTMSARSKLLIAFSLGITAAAVVVALRVLQEFKWA
jgi:uncharacterized membrane protein